MNSILIVSGKLVVGPWFEYLFHYYRMWHQHIESLWEVFVFHRQWLAPWTEQAHKILLQLWAHCCFFFFNSSLLLCCPWDCQKSSWLYIKWTPVILRIRMPCSRGNIRVSHIRHNQCLPPHPPSPCQFLNSITYTLWFLIFWFKFNSAWFLNKGKFRIFSSRVYTSTRILSNIKCGTLVPLEHPMAFVMSFTGVKFYALTLYKIFVIRALSRKKKRFVCSVAHVYCINKTMYIM